MGKLSIINELLQSNFKYLIFDGTLYCWLKLEPKVKWVILEGNFETSWLKCEPKVKWVIPWGNLYTFWLKW